MDSAPSVSPALYLASASAPSGVETIWVTAPRNTAISGRVRSVSRRQFGDIVVLRRHQGRTLGFAGTHLEGELVDLNALGPYGRVGHPLLGGLGRRSGEQGGGHLGSRIDRRREGRRGGEHARQQHQRSHDPRRHLSHDGHRAGPGPAPGVLASLAESSPTERARVIAAG